MLKLISVKQLPAKQRIAVKKMHPPEIVPTEALSQSPVYFQPQPTMEKQPVISSRRMLDTCIAPSGLGHLLTFPQCSTLTTPVAIKESANAMTSMVDSTPIMSVGLIASQMVPQHTTSSRCSENGGRSTLNITMLKLIRLWTTR